MLPAKKKKKAIISLNCINRFVMATDFCETESRGFKCCTNGKVESGDHLEALLLFRGSV